MYIRIEGGDETQKTINFKVRKRQYQYPEFGHTQGEIFLKPAKMYNRIEGGDETQKPINFKLMVFSVSPCLSFLLSASMAAAT
jgi:hypothetical protein